MKTELSPNFQQRLKDIKRSNPKLFQKILKQLKIFQINHKHPSLRKHKLSGHLKDTRSVSAGMKIRILYNLTPEGTAYFFDIGTHDEVYKK